MWSGLTNMQNGPEDGREGPLAGGCINGQGSMLHQKKIGPQGHKARTFSRSTHALIVQNSTPTKTKLRRDTNISRGSGEPASTNRIRSLLDPRWKIFNKILIRRQSNPQEKNAHVKRQQNVNHKKRISTHLRRRWWSVWPTAFGYFSNTRQIWPLVLRISPFTRILFVVLSCFE